MIQLKDVEKYFFQGGEKVDVLHHINLHIKPQECVVLEGVSGSGKTTLLHLIASFMKPSSGMVMVDGENIASLPDFHASLYRNTTIGYVTQSFYLLDMLSVYENLYPPLVVDNLSKEQIEEKIIFALELANIAHKKFQKVATLSGGERQRVIIARAIVNNPKIVLCDEPTANLDIANTQEFFAIMERLKQHNTTILIATHDPLFNNQKWVDKRYKMKEGRLV
jgi:putative ABC transport system ATP-binding protein